MTYRFYDNMPEKTYGMNLYRVVQRSKSTDPKVGGLEAALYLLAESQSEAMTAIARDLGGAGRYIPVLVEKNGKKIHS